MFTKEYIELCKNEKIQGLRKVLLKYGDWYSNEYDSIFLVHGGLSDSNKIWLPTGDQLDEEIVKICKEKNHNIRMHYIKEGDYHSGYWDIGYYYSADFDIPLYVEANTNPLIAKIKLLIQLLEVK